MRHARNVVRNLPGALLPLHPDALSVPISSSYVATKSIDDFYAKCSAPPMVTFHILFPAPKFVLLPPQARVRLPEPVLLFRGDGRPPREVFANGMQPGRLDAYRRGRPAYRPSPGDLLPGSAVSLTRDVQVAPIFPLEVSSHDFIERSFVYLVAIDDYYDLHHIQADRAFRKWKRPVWFDLHSQERGVNFSFVHIPSADEHNSRDLIFAHELATMGVPPRRVLGALSIRRERMNGGDKTRFVVEDVVWNGSARVEMDRTAKAKFEGMKGESYYTPSAADYGLEQHGYRMTSESPDWGRGVVKRILQSAATTLKYLTGKPG